MNFSIFHFQCRDACRAGGRWGLWGGPCTQIEVFMKKAEFHWKSCTCDTLCGKSNPLGSDTPKWVIVLCIPVLFQTPGEFGTTVWGSAHPAAQLPLPQSIHNTQNSLKYTPAPYSSLESCTYSATQVKQPEHSSSTTCLLAATLYDRTLHGSMIKPSMKDKAALLSGSQ